MSDLRARLERLGVRARVPDGAFERLERRRRRQVRNRRVAAGVVALAVALGGTYAAFTAFRGTERGTVGGGPPGADTVRITCDRTTIQVDVPAVAAQPAGVHVVVENTTRESLSFVFASSAQGPVNATQVGPGTAALALQLPPGRASFMCIAEFEEVATEQVEVDVLDPRGFFVPFDLTCSGEPMVITPPSAVSWPGSEVTEAPDPVEFVRAVADGLLPSDVLERAGYPQAPNPVVRAVREGEVVAVFDLSMAETGWTAGHVSCGGARISLPSEPGPYPRGAFEWCPDPPFREPGLDWSEQASAATLGFVEAYAAGDDAAVAELLDPSVPPDAEFPVELAEGAEPTAISTNAAGGLLVEFACGNDVGAYTVAITVDDGTDSASLDFTVYLVLREDGWKVWAVY